VSKTLREKSEIKFESEKSAKEAEVHNQVAGRRGNIGIFEEAASSMPKASIGVDQAHAAMLSLYRFCASYSLPSLPEMLCTEHWQ
jgi:hypothetical protein